MKRPYVLTELSEGHSNNANFTSLDDAIREMQRRCALPKTSYPVDYRVWREVGYYEYRTYATATRDADTSWHIIEGGK